MKKNKLVFAITEQDLQQEALIYIGRKLTQSEIQTAKKGLESGLTTDIETIYRTIFNEMIVQ